MKLLSGLPTKTWAFSRIKMRFISIGKLLHHLLVYLKPTSKMKCSTTRYSPLKTLSQPIFVPHLEIAETKRNQNLEQKEGDEESEDESD